MEGKNKRSGRPGKNLEGQRFGKLYVLKSVGHYNPKTNHHYSLVRCDCGQTFYTMDTYLVNHRRTQCPDCSRLKRTTHQMTKSRIYHVYQSMKGRCYNPNNKKYKDYGGRGIKVCDEWKNDAWAFIKWAYDTGYDENADYMDCTLDRINVDGDYCPDNCRWANGLTQARNKRSSHYINYKGKCISAQELSEITGIKYVTILNRIRNNFSDEDVAKTKEEIKKCHHKTINNKMVTLKFSNTGEIFQFKSLKEASHFLGHNDSYISTMASRKNQKKFETGGYIIEIK